MNTRRELLLASTNAGKIRELTELLAGVPVRLRSLTEFPHLDIAEETGETFDDNAAIKAEFYGRLTNLSTLADDSGLEVAALGGAPGVHSARYAGAGATDEQRTARLLEELKRAEELKRGGVFDRSARFVCVVALYETETEEFRFFRGVCEGRIAGQPRGSHGFGYDPVFIPDGYDESFAELPPDVKRRISHRARALSGAKRYLLGRFGSESESDETAR
jgi:XTP/dITP diphosphohydrolase